MQWASGTGAHWQCGTGTGTSQSGTDTSQSCTGTTASCKPIFACYVILSPVFVHRLFTDPNKLLVGVQIRMGLSEKRNVPCCLDEASIRLGDIRLTRLFV